jgi:hypothetical protein
MRRSFAAAFAFATAALLVLSAACSKDETESVPTTVCASGTRWIGEDEGSSKMHPGRDCIACHSRESDAPSFTFAGTVFSERSQANDCFGRAGTVVRIIDANGATFDMGANEAGNFYANRAVALPYTVELYRDGEKVNDMKTPQTSGACNSCHTAEGTSVGGAEAPPGRITSP